MRLLAAACFSAALSVSCADTARWSTQEGESYCGNVTSASFVRAGMTEGTQLRIELDAEGLQNAPGRIWSTPFVTGERFTGTALRAIPQLLHDPLSTLSFGEGRVKNAIVIGDLTTADGTATNEVFVVLSLLQSGDVEVRVMRGASQGSAPPSDKTPPQLFGVFRLTKQKGDCGVR